MRGNALQADLRANFEAWMKAAGLNMNQIAEATGVQYNTIRSYLVEIKGKRTGSLSGENESKIAGAYNLAVEDIFGPAPGSEAQPNHLRAWREFKKVPQDVLAERIRRRAGDDGGPWRLADTDRPSLEMAISMTRQ